MPASPTLISTGQGKRVAKSGTDLKETRRCFFIAFILPPLVYEMKSIPIIPSLVEKIRPYIFFGTPLERLCEMEVTLSFMDHRKFACTLEYSMLIDKTTPPFRSFDN